MPSAGYAQRWTARQRRRRRHAWGPSVATTPATVTFPTTSLVSRAWIALNPDFTQSYLSWAWADITDYVRWETGVNIESGRRDQSETVDPSAARLTLDNRDGRFSRGNPVGPYYGLLSKNTPIWLALDPGTGFTDRYMGFVNEWPKRWDRSATDATVEIVCGGPLRRLLRQRPLRSPMFYSISGAAANDYQPRAYWPMEDGVDSTQIASAISGHDPMSIVGSVLYASNSDLTGSDPLPLLVEGSNMTATVPTYTATGKWVVQVVFCVPIEPAAEITIMEVFSTGGTGASYKVTLDPAGGHSLGLFAYDSSGTIISGALTSVDPDIFYGRWFTFAIAVRPYSVTPTSVLFTQHHFDALGTSEGPFGNTIPTTVPGIVTRVRLTATEDINFGHLAVFTDANFDTTTDVSATAPAMYGHPGEQAHERIARLCREQRIPYMSQAATSAVLGPQPAGKLVDVLRDAEKADQGVVYEYQFGLAFQSLAERYNQPNSLAIDVATGQVADDLEPEDSDLRFRNQWTANRRDGSSATVQGRAGVAGVTLADTEALYEDEDTFGVEADDQLDDLAGWLAHRDSMEDDYWPNVGINLAKNPELIPAWTALGYGARMSVANLMSQADSDSLDLIFEGHREHWNSREWNVLMNTSPASIFEVFVLDDVDFGRLDSGTSTLSAAAATGAVSLVVAVSDSTDLWTTDSAQWPFDVEVSGIPVTVTAVAGASSPQTFTVTGVTKDLSAGEQVRLASGVVLAL